MKLNSCLSLINLFLWALACAPVYVPYPPVVDQVVPLKGKAGALVTVDGKGFGSNPRVYLGSKAVAINSYITNHSADIVTFKVPVGAKSGKVQVMSEYNLTGTSAEDFFVMEPPVITGFTPASGPVGSTVIISGSNFLIPSSPLVVLFGSVSSTLLQASDGSLQVRVPTGAVTSKISVTTDGGTTITDTSFIVN